MGLHRHGWPLRETFHVESSPVFLWGASSIKAPKVLFVKSAGTSCILRFRSAGPGWFNTLVFQKSTLWKWGSVLHLRMLDQGWSCFLNLEREGTGGQDLGAWGQERKKDTFCPRGSQWVWRPDEMRTRNKKVKTGGNLEKYWDLRYTEVSVSVVYCGIGQVHSKSLGYTGVPGTLNTWSYLWRGCMLLHLAIQHLYSHPSSNPKLRVGFKGWKNKGQF